MSPRRWRLSRVRLPTAGLKTALSIRRWLVEASVVLLVARLLDLAMHYQRKEQDLLFDGQA